MKKIRYLLITSLLLITAVFSTSCRKDFDIGNVKITIKLPGENTSSRDATDDDIRKENNRLFYKDITSYKLYVINKVNDEFQIYTEKTFQPNKTNLFKLKEPGLYYFILLPLNKDNHIIGNLTMNKKSYINDSYEIDKGENYFNCTCGNNTLIFDLDLSDYYKEFDDNNYWKLKKLIENEFNYKKIVDDYNSPDDSPYYLYNIINEEVNKLIPYKEFGNEKTIILTKNISSYDNEDEDEGDSYMPNISITNNNIITLKGNLKSPDTPVEQNFITMNVYENEDSIISNLFIINENGKLKLDNIVLKDNSGNLSNNPLILVEDSGSFIAENVNFVNFFKKINTNKDYYNSSIISGTIDNSNKDSLDNQNKIILNNVTISNCMVKNFVKQELKEKVSNLNNEAVKQDKLQTNNEYLKKLGYIKISNIKEDKSEYLDSTVYSELPLILDGYLRINSIHLSANAAHMMSYESLNNIKTSSQIFPKFSEIADSQNCIYLELDRVNKEIEDDNDPSADRTNYLFAGTDFSCKQEGTDNGMFYIFSNINNSNYSELFDFGTIFEFSNTNDRRNIYNNTVYFTPKSFPETESSTGTTWNYQILNSFHDNEILYILLQNYNSVFIPNQFYFSRPHYYNANKDVTINFDQIISLSNNIIFDNKLPLTYYSKNNTITLNRSSDTDDYLLQWHGNVNLTNVKFTNTDYGLEIFTHNDGAYNVSLENCTIPSIKVTNIGNVSNSRLVINVDTKTSGKPLDTPGAYNLIKIDMTNEYIEANYLDENKNPKYPLFTQNSSIDYTQKFELTSNQYRITKEGYIKPATLDYLLSSNQTSVTPFYEINNRVSSNISSEINITSNKNVYIDGTNNNNGYFNIEQNNTININAGTTNFNYYKASTAMSDSPDYFVNFNNNSELPLFNVDEDTTLNLSKINVHDKYTFSNVNALLVKSSGNTNIYNSNFYTSKASRPVIIVNNGTTKLIDVEFLQGETFKIYNYNDEEVRSISSRTKSILIKNNGNLVLGGNCRIDKITIDCNSITSNNNPTPIISFGNFDYIGCSFKYSKNNDEHEITELWIELNGINDDNKSKFLYNADNPNIIPIYKITSSETPISENPGSYICTLGYIFQPVEITPYEYWYYLKEID